MAGSIYIDIPSPDGLAELLAGDGVGVAADCDSATLAIRRDRGRQSEMDVLYADGWVACEAARGMAGRLGVSLPAMGELLELLNVKVRRCGLGCF